MSKVRKAKRVKKEYPKIGRKKVKSNFEYQIYNTINGALPNFATVEYEPEKISYSISATYCPDFVVTFKTRPTMYIETKGYFDYDDRRKMLAIKEQRPDLDVRLLFMKDSTLGRGSKTRYSDWCLKNGYQCAFGTVPEDWLEE